MQGQDVSDELCEPIYLFDYIPHARAELLDATNSACILDWISQIKRHPCVADSQAVHPMFIQAKGLPHFQNPGLFFRQ